ncbi:MAG: pseudouridine-5'-phosphate glycosidase [Hyphomicrobiales bacterium]
MTVLDIRPEIADQLARGGGVVALESTVIAHGLPAPHNIDIALGMEAAVRQAGAVPATIAVLEGRFVIGLSQAEIRALAEAPKGAVRKASRRDLAIATGLGGVAATTVSATMIGARLAGISVFATGGIGGVHRGAPFDISADLTELGRTPVAVICSGPKAILDIPATREVLETQGVPVIGYGTGDLPAFYSPTTGFAADARVDTATEAANLILAQRELGLQSGLLFGVPVPGATAVDAGKMEIAIVRATNEAHAAGIAGHQTTPFVLARVAELTDNASLRANMALLLNNARVAGEIASALAGGN